MTAGTIERRIADAGIRLRFDRVALRLLESVKSGVGPMLTAEESVAFTVTAPIRLPARTSAALQEQLRELRTQELSTTINGNAICARKIKNTSTDAPRVIGFVHNPGVNADLILDLAEAALRER